MVSEKDIENFEKSKEHFFKIEDKWILTKLNKLVVEITDNIENYDLGIALDKIYNFIWNDFAIGILKWLKQD